MKKPKLNVDRMQSELSESRFFQRARAPQDGTDKDPIQDQEADVSAPPRAEQRPYGRTPKQSTLTRVPFELYVDQLETLRQLSLEEKSRGEKGSMSEMVRAAL